MADEKEVEKKEVDTEKVETEKPTEKAEEKVEEKTEEKVEEKATEPEIEPETEPEANKVNEIENSNAAIRVEDIVTKDLLEEKMSALEAKLDAFLKENTDLKNELSAMKDKYENKDFGSLTKQGMIEKNTLANSSFDEYSKAFM